jgi:hypothetical protein
MTELEWLACTEPEKMLAFQRNKASDRKLRLFAVACCRRIPRLDGDRANSKAVEVAERYVEGLATDDDLATAALEVYCSPYYTQAGAYASTPVPDTGRMPGKATPPIETTTDAANLAAQEAARVIARNNSTRLTHEHHLQCCLLRDVFGNPFRPVTIDSSWLTWNDSTVVKLAQAIYLDRAFDRLLILADALEEAGSTNADILDHCRQSGEHVRGCWVVDLLLGKK